jgi:replication fork clamp-binding protein CrfC
LPAIAAPRCALNIGASPPPAALGLQHCREDYLVKLKANAYVMMLFEMSRRDVAP